MPFDIGTAAYLGLVGARTLPYRYDARVRSMFLSQADVTSCAVLSGILGREPVRIKSSRASRRLEISRLRLGRIGERTSHFRRAQGKLKQLEDRLLCEPAQRHHRHRSHTVATHGRPSEVNAHPHATDVVAVVHNGIIENFRQLRRELEAVAV